VSVKSPHRIVKEIDPSGILNHSIDPPVDTLNSNRMQPIRRHHRRLEWVGIEITCNDGSLVLRCFQKSNFVRDPVEKCSPGTVIIIPSIRTVQDHHEAIQPGICDESEIANTVQRSAEQLKRRRRSDKHTETRWCPNLNKAIHSQQLRKKRRTVCELDQKNDIDLPLLNELMDQPIELFPSEIPQQKFRHNGLAGLRSAVLVSPFTLTER